MGRANAPTEESIPALAKKCASTGKTTPPATRGKEPMGWADTTGSWTGSRGGATEATSSTGTATAAVEKPAGERDEGNWTCE